MKLKRLLLTGAAGGMGTALRPLLSGIAETVVVSARREITDLAAHEVSIPADLTDIAALDAAVAGCDGVIHLGGYSVEGPFRPIMESNILGLYNLYEAARAHGMPRIVFASSNHAVGYHELTTRLDADAPLRPDSLYGVSKAYGEALASFYHSKFGQETGIVRIGSCFEKPEDHRGLSTWLSYRDFVALCGRIFFAPRLGCPIIYGASDNTRSIWDNHQVAWLGWRPQDDAEQFAPAIEAAIPDPDPESPVSRYHGGKFTSFPLMTETD